MWIMTGKKTNKKNKHELQKEFPELIFLFFHWSFILPGTNVSQLKSTKINSIYIIYMGVKTPWLQMTVRFLFLCASECQKRGPGRHTHVLQCPRDHLGDVVRRHVPVRRPRTGLNGVRDDGENANLCGPKQHQQISTIKG